MGQKKLFHFCLFIWKVPQKIVMCGRLCYFLTHRSAIDRTITKIIEIKNEQLPHWRHVWCTLPVSVKQRALLCILDLWERRRFTAELDLFSCFCIDLTGRENVVYQSLTSILCSGLSSRSKAETVLITPANTNTHIHTHQTQVLLAGSESAGYT